MDHLRKIGEAIKAYRADHQGRMSSITNWTLAGFIFGVYTRTAMVISGFLVEIKAYTDMMEKHSRALRLRMDWQQT